jgi:hypothetical protein
MGLPFTPDQFFDVFAAYNERLWPCALALWLLTAWTVIALARGRSVPSWFVPALLALHWAWSGLAYHAAFFSAINPAAWLFSLLFAIESALWLWHGVVRRRYELAPGSRFQRAMFWLSIVYALAYPAIALAGGHAYPRVPTFGVPCPTTILTIAFLIAANRTWPRTAAAVPLLWSCIGGAAAFLFGVRADLMLLASGVALAATLIRPVRTIASPSASPSPALPHKPFNVKTAG